MTTDDPEPWAQGRRSATGRGARRTGRSADNLVEGCTEGTCLLGVELDDESATTLERDAHHDAAPFLRDLERAVARPRLHRRHAHTSSLVLRGAQPVWSLPHRTEDLPVA